MSAWTGGVDTTFTFTDGYLYKLEIVGGSANTDSAGTTGMNIIRVRKGVNTTSGQQLLQTVTFTRGGSNVISFAAHSYVKNASGADITTALGVTVAGLVLHVSHWLQGHQTMVWSDFWPAFVVVGLCSFASIPITRRLPLGAGDEVARGKRQ